MLIAPAVYASAPQPIAGLFFFTPGSTISTKSAGANTIVTYNFIVSLTGSQSGTYVGVERDVMHPDGTVTFNNTGTFTGTVLGRSGTFVELVQGKYSLVDCTISFGTMVFEKGTGDLANLHGHGTFGGGICTSGTYSGTVQFAGS